MYISNTPQVYFFNACLWQTYGGQRLSARIKFPLDSHLYFVCYVRAWKKNTTHTKRHAFIWGKTMKGGFFPLPPYT